jgi:unsaturated chondroitin disaccharide hydrolase
MIKIDKSLNLERFKVNLDRFWAISGKKIIDIHLNYDEKAGSPVFTINGKYTSRGWTEWTQGFVYGSALLQYDATGEQQFLEIGRSKTLTKMAPHLSHIGVHDHGFNNISTYGNLLRLQKENKIPHNDWEKHFYELAIKLSGAAQATRWTTTQDGGFIYSFNGPHSLFVDTIRSCRALMVSHKLGHVLQAENDERINLLHRAVDHMLATAKYAVFYGEGRDSYDIPGRTAHESIFNTNNGQFRCPNSQQGYTGFTTWTRGLAWAICGFAEELEFLETIDPKEFEPKFDLATLKAIFAKAAKATADFYINHTPICGIPYWDTGAPNLYKLGDYLNEKANPYNSYEPVDSSAAAIAAQGFLRLGKYLENENYTQVAYAIFNSLLSDTYLSNDAHHQGLLLHSIYHQPNGWDHVPEGSKIAYGEACQWGDYHLRELALMLTKQLKNEPYLSFYNV